MLACDDRRMMTRELEVSILAAPLAAIDRRALSQAWYSALRFSAGERGGVISRCAADPPRSATIVPFRLRSFESIVHAGCGARPAYAPRRAATGTFANEGLPRAQRKRLSLARRIERTFADVQPCPKRATFSLGRGNARVHIILQTIGTSSMLLALCRPELRAVVRDALGQARAALAARGISVELRLAESRQCFSTQA